MSFNIEMNESELVGLYKLLRSANSDPLMQGVLKKIENAVYEVASIGEIEDIGENERT
jgi:hypothetical protein